jgi:hypothetical protein
MAPNAPATHCWACGKRFMGQPRIDVFYKVGPIFELKRVVTVHESCFNPRRMRRA